MPPDAAAPSQKGEKYARRSPPLVALCASDSCARRGRQKHWRKWLVMNLRAERGTNPRGVARDGSLFIAVTRVHHHDDEEDDHRKDHHEEDDKVDRSEEVWKCAGLNVVCSFSASFDATSVDL